MGRFAPRDRLRVLLVEDNPGDVDLVLESLGGEAAALHIDQVQTLAAALHRLSAGDVDVVLLDLSLPDASGLKAVERVRVACPNVPIVVLTSSQDESLGSRAVNSGAQDYLVKGESSGGMLVRAMRYAVERQRVAQAREEATETAARAHRLRMSFLAEVSLHLRGKLDTVLLRERLGEVAALAVPQFADCCIIARPRRSTATLIALRHVAPEKEALVRALYQSAAEPLPHEADIDVLEAVDLTPSPMFGELAVCSRICARIDASDPSAGTITFLFTDASSRRYGSEDLGMIRHLAQIVHIAMENVRMSAEMRRAVDLREDFVAIASHELRTPLSTLVLQLGRLRKGLEPLADDGPNGPVASWNMVERQTNRLERLVDTLLDVARSGAESIVLHRESADLGTIVSGMIERLGEQAAQVGTVMHLDEGEPVVGSWDRMRVEQIVTNLLSNTLKYAAGKPVYVRVSTSEQNGVVSVRDEGIGIAPDDLGRVFERFERGVTVQRYAGLGLGLHISRALAVAHGGTIEVTSTLGEGSTFVLTLPLVHAERTSFLPRKVH